MSKESRFRVPGLPGSPFIRALALVCAASVTASVALAAAWLPAGIPLSNAGGAQSSLRTVTDGRGGFIAAWVDTNGGLPRLLAQRVDSTGAPQWTAGGVVVSSNTDSIKQVTAAPDGQNGLLLAWTARQAPARYLVYLQRLNAAGAEQWTAGGLRADSTAADTLQGQPAITASDGNGGAIVAWSENRGATDYDVYLQRISATGTRLWATSGVDVDDPDTDDQANPRLLSDGAGGAWASWEDLSATPRTFFQRFDPSGAAQWTAGGVTPTANADPSLNAFMARVPGSDSLLIVWSETTPDQIQGTRVTPAGDFVSGGGNTLRATASLPVGLVMQSGGSAILFYASASAISALAVTTSALPSGSPLTVATGQTLTATSNVHAVGDGGNGAFVVWASGGAAYARHVSPAVTNDWAAAVPLTSGVTPSQTHPSAVAGADLLAAWVDARNAGTTGDDLYMQRVSPSGVTGSYHRLYATVAGGTGAFSAGGGRTWVRAGDSLRVVFAGTSGQHVDHTVVGATNLGAVPNYTFRNVAGDSALQAYFSAAALTQQVAAVASAYRAFSLPFTPVPATVASNFANLMPYDTARWRLGHWEADDSTYLEPSGPLTNLAAGAGYWFIGLKDTMLSFSGTALPEAQFSLPMLGGPVSGRGWTQFGSPFRFPVAVSQLRLSSGPDVPITDAGNALTDHQVLEWNPSNSTYEPQPVLLPGRVYWLWRQSASAISLRFPYEWNPVATGGLMPALATGAEWSVGVTARSGEREAHLSFGAANVAANRWNGLSGHALPAGPGDALTLVARVGDWGDDNGDYRSVFRPDASELRYEFDASAPAGLTETALTFDFDRLPADRRVVLSEPATGWSREVTADAAVPVVLSANARRFRLEVLAGSPVPPRVPLETVLRAVGPNPFRDAATLSFSLAHAGPLRWDVFDLAGRRVTSGARTLDVGEHALTWDGRDAAGVRVRPGLYLVRWQADGRSGAARLVLMD